MTLSRQAASFWFVVALVIAGCTSTPPTYSCDNDPGTGSHSCTDYIAGYTETTAASGCVPAGTFSSTNSCPAAGRVCRCRTTYRDATSTATSQLSGYGATFCSGVRVGCVNDSSTPTILEEYFDN